MEFNLDMEEFAPHVIECANTVHRAERRRQHELEFALEDYGAAKETASEPEQFRAALEFVNALSSANERFAVTEMRAKAKSMLPMMEQLGAPADVIEAARRAAGLELPGNIEVEGEIHEIETDGEGNVLSDREIDPNDADRFVSGESTIEGISIDNVLSEDPEGRGIRDFDGGLGDEDEGEGDSA